MLQIDLKFILTVALFIIEVINTYFCNPYPIIYIELKL